MDLLVKGTAHARMKVIGAKITVKTSATSNSGQPLLTLANSDIGRLTKSLKEER